MSLWKQSPGRDAQGGPPDSRNDVGPLALGLTGSKENGCRCHQTRNQKGSP
jgi:hypothetical protein